MKIVDFIMKVRKKEKVAGFLDLLNGISTDDYSAKAECDLVPQKDEGSGKDFFHIQGTVEVKRAVKAQDFEYEDVVKNLILDKVGFANLDDFQQLALRVRP